MGMASSEIDDFRLCFLMETNAVPTDLECTHIRQCIVNCKAEMANLGDRVRKAEGAVDELVREYERQHRSLLALERVLLRIRCIPPEILSYIFLLGLALVGGATPHPNMPPLIYGRVCSFWRSVSHSTPMLWATLTLEINKTETPQFLVDLAKEWLHRADPCPLDVSLLCEESPTGGRIVEHAILPFTAHLMRLDLSLPSDQLESLTGASGFPLLEVLDLNNYKHKKGSLPCLTFIQSPRLRSVILRSRLLLESDIAMFPWPQLTELELDFQLEPHSIIELLSLMPRLQELTVVIDYRRKPARRHFIHTNLISLYVKAYQSNGISQLLKALTLPALRCFASLGEMELAALIDFHGRSGFRLETLSLAKLLNTDAHLLVSFLRRLPDLTDVSLYDIHADKILLDALCYHPVEDNLLPHLEVLEISDERTPLICRDYLDMIRTRWWPGRDLKSNPSVTCLESLRATISRPLIPEETRQIAEFCKQGLEVSFTWHSSR